MRRTLEEYLKLEYPFNVIADPDGGYVVVYPDLPGCLTVADSIEEVALMAEDVRRGWLTVAYEHDMDIPLPSYPAEFSGKFNVRLPRSLHRRLAEAAERDGVSLNTYVIGLLERGSEQDDLIARLEAVLEAHRSDALSPSR
jgi:predicted RNase H-like HicB family nuclease